MKVHRGQQPGIASRNPTTGKLVKEFQEISQKELRDRLSRAAETFESFKNSSFTQRAGWLKRAGAILESEKTRLGKIMTLEMGKPIKAAIQEVEKCALACRFYAENGARFLAEEKVEGSQRFVRYEPLGAILVVMPWNFPFWQVFRFAAPALMAGNVGLLKHSSNVPQCALAIEKILVRGGFPRGAFQTLLIGSERVQEVIEDQRVRAVTLTGSVGAGSKVAALAGRAIKKTVLELGGSDPFIVMPSANLAEAVSTAVRARTVNNGQSCIAAKRFIVHRRIIGEFQERFTRLMSQLKVGDPIREETDVGPLATEEVLAGLQQQVDQTIRKGATLLLGGKRLAPPGFFFAPTVLAQIPPNSPARDEELFGPVASIFESDDVEDAIRIANETRFGLGACAWTNDRREQARFVEAIDAGLVFINGMVSSDPAMPFGGVKQSGYGRELSWHGIREFVNAKTVVINDKRSLSGKIE